MYLNLNHDMEYIYIIGTLNVLILIILFGANPVLGSANRSIDIRRLPTICDFLDRNENFITETTFKNLTCDKYNEMPNTTLDIKSFFKNPDFETYLNEIEYKVMKSSNCEYFKQSAIEFKKELTELFGFNEDNIDNYTDQKNLSKKNIYNNQEILKLKKLWKKMSCIEKTDCDLPPILIEVMNKNNDIEFNNNTSLKAENLNNPCQYKETEIEDKVLWFRKALVKAKEQGLNLSEDLNIKKYIKILGITLMWKYKTNGEYLKSQGFINWPVFPYIYMYFKEDATKIGILKEYTETFYYKKFMEYYHIYLNAPDILDYIDFDKYLESIDELLQNKPLTKNTKLAFNYLIGSIEIVLENDYYNERQKVILRRLLEKMSCILYIDYVPPSILIEIMEKSDRIIKNKINLPRKISTGMNNGLSESRISNKMEHSGNTIDDKILWLRQALSEAKKQKKDLSGNLEVKNYIEKLGKALADLRISDGKYLESEGYIDWPSFPYINKYLKKNATKIGILKEYVKDLDFYQFGNYYYIYLNSPDIFKYINFEKYLKDVEDLIAKEPLTRDEKWAIDYIIKYLENILKKDYYGERQKDILRKLLEKMSYISYIDCDIPTILIKVMNKSDNTEFKLFQKLSSKLSQYDGKTIEDKILWLRKVLNEAKKQQINLSKNLCVKNYIEKLGLALALKYKSSNKYSELQGSIDWTTFPYINKYFKEDATEIGILKEYAETLDFSKFRNYYINLNFPDIFKYVDFEKYLENIENLVKNKPLAINKSIILSFNIGYLKSLLKYDYYNKEQRKILKKLMKKMKLIKNKL